MIQLVPKHNFFKTPCALLEHTFDLKLILSRGKINKHSVYTGSSLELLSLKYQQGISLQEASPFAYERLKKSFKNVCFYSMVQDSLTNT